MLPQPSTLPALPDNVEWSTPLAGQKQAAADGSTESDFMLALNSEMLRLPLPSAVLPPTDESARSTASQVELRELSRRETERIRDTAQQLESLLLYQLLKQMWNSIPESSLLPTGQAGKIYREMWLEKVSETSSLHGGLGIAKVVEQQLTQQAQRTYSPEQARERFAGLTSLL
jgi:hypothetical protein